MRARRAIDRYGPSAEIGRVNVTPMIDVVMCLIIFYLIVGHLVMERQGEARLPESARGEETARDDEPIVLAVLDGGLVLVDGVETELDRLESVLAGRLAQRPGARVRLRAGRELAYGTVDPVVQACRGAGVASIELATERVP